MFRVIIILSDDWDEGITLDDVAGRVITDAVGRICLPMVGMPLLRPWLNDEALRGIDD